MLQPSIRSRPRIVQNGKKKEAAATGQKYRLSGTIRLHTAGDQLLETGFNFLYANNLRSTPRAEVIHKGGVEDRTFEAKDSKKSEAKAKDLIFDDRPSRGQEQECSRPKQGPKTQLCKWSQKNDCQKKQVIEFETKVNFKFSLVIFLFNESKNNAVLDPRTGHFRGLVGFEAKDLTFEAKDLSFKAKDFKMCPRGLHL